MHPLTLKEFAYLHFRKHGATPRQAVYFIRNAVRAGSRVERFQFEDAVNLVCGLLHMPTAFSGPCQAA